MTDLHDSQLDQKPNEARQAGEHLGCGCYETCVYGDPTGCYCEGEECDGKCHIRQQESVAGTTTDLSAFIAKTPGLAPGPKDLYDLGMDDAERRIVEWLHTPVEWTGDPTPYIEERGMDAEQFHWLVRRTHDTLADQIERGEHRG